MDEVDASQLKIAANQLITILLFEDLYQPYAFVVWTALSICKYVKT